MPTLTLNTGHALYGNLQALFCVSNGAITDLKTARTFSAHPSGSITYGTGTWGAHMQCRASGANVVGASFTPVYSYDSGSNACTIVYISNTTITDTTQYTGSSGGSFIGSTAATAANYFPEPGISTIFKPQSYWAYTLKNTAASAISTSSGHMYTLTRGAGDSTTMNLYIDANSTPVISGGDPGSSNAATKFDLLGGYQGQQSAPSDMVYCVIYNKVLSTTEIADLYNSLGANNAFGPVTVAGTTRNLTAANASMSSTSSGAVITKSTPRNLTASNAAMAPTSSGAIITKGGATITTKPIKNNTGQLLKGVGATLYVHNATTSALVGSATGLTTNATTGTLSTFVTGTVASTTYFIRVVLANGQEGVDKVTAT